MMHEYYEMGISGVVALSTPVFLEMCSLYLEAANTRAERWHINQQAREYGRRFGLKLGMEYADYLLDWEAYPAEGGDHENVQ